MNPTRTVFASFPLVLTLLAGCEVAPTPTRSARPLPPRTAYVAPAPAPAAAPVAAPAPRPAGLYLEVYDVRDLVTPHVDFLPPVINGLPTGDSDTTPRSGGEGEEQKPFIEPDVLVMIVKEATNPKYWDETEGASIDITDTGMMLVRAHAAIQQRIGLGLSEVR